MRRWLRERYCSWPWPV